MSAPAKDDTKTFVVGVNESTYNGEKKLYQMHLVLQTVLDQ